MDFPFYISYKNDKPKTDAPIPVLTLSRIVDKNIHAAIHKYFRLLVAKYIVIGTVIKTAKKSANEAYDTKRPPDVKLRKTYRGLMNLAETPPIINAYPQHIQQVFSKKT